MHWLFICGIALDLAGAVLIAWTIYSRTATEVREEATSRLDANLWTVIFREREQAHVKAGMSALATGFVLQLCGYILELNGNTDRLLAPLVAAVVFLAALLGLRGLAGRVAPLKVVDVADLPDTIHDERHSHRVRQEDIGRYRLMWLSRIAHRPIIAREEIVKPRINHGRWLFDCPICDACGTRSSAAVTPEIPTALCRNCGSEFPIDFPDDRVEIERLLMLRSNLSNRNWDGSETVAQLAEENRVHGLTP